MTVGHNTLAGDQLRGFVERIERANEAVADAQQDVKDLYVEVKSSGLDTRIVKKIVRMRKVDLAKRQEEEALTEMYLHALGMI